MDATTPVRRLFHAGKITHRKEPRPCSMDNHAGPLLRAALFNAQPDAMWHGMGECAVCGSTIHRRQLRPRAA